MPLRKDHLPNEGAHGEPDQATGEGTVNGHARLTAQVEREVSLALARWAIAVLLHRCGTGPGA
jgi:hypothetical protein